MYTKPWLPPTVAPAPALADSLGAEFRAATAPVRAPLEVDFERMAAAELRSANAEIEVLLREALARRGVTIKAPVAAKRGRPPKEDSGS